MDQVRLPVSREFSVLELRAKGCGDFVAEPMDCVFV
jgi:hypothetical protein